MAGAPELRLRPRLSSSHAASNSARVAESLALKSVDTPMPGPASRALSRRCPFVLLTGVSGDVMELEAVWRRGGRGGREGGVRVRISSQ